MLNCVQDVFRFSLIVLEIRFFIESEEYLVWEVPVQSNAEVKRVFDIVLDSYADSIVTVNQTFSKFTWMRLRQFFNELLDAKSQYYGLTGIRNLK